MEKKSLYINLGIFGACLLIIIASFFFFGKGTNHDKFIDSKIYEIETRSVSATMKDKPPQEPISIYGETLSNQYDCRGGGTCINVSNYEDGKKYVISLPVFLEEYPKAVGYKFEAKCNLEKGFCTINDINNLKMEKIEMLFPDEVFPNE